MRNAKVLQEWVDKCRALAKARVQDHQATVFVDLTTRYPQLLDIITIDGGYNQGTIQKRVESMRKAYERARAETGEDASEFDVEIATKQAIGDLERDLGSMIRDYPLMSKMLHFNMPPYPEDMDGLVLGIECIKACADIERMDDVDRATFTNDDEWMDVSASEVAAWIQNFCDNISPRRI